MKLEEREYQGLTEERVRDAYRTGKKAVVLRAPTGSGKTIMAGRIIQKAVEKGKKVLFFAHRRELIRQCSEKLGWFEVPHGLILAGFSPSYRQPVQIASYQTMNVRFMKKPVEGQLFVKAPPQADMVVFDEGHKFLEKQLEIRKVYPDAFVLGLTATPVRSDGRGLGELYDSMVHAPSVRELMDMGKLVPMRHYAPTRPDLSGVKVKRTGDYDEGQLEQTMDDAKLRGDIIKHWLELAGDRRTVVFASGVEHSIHLRDQFRQAGAVAEHIDANTSTEERDDILRRLKRGMVQVVTNCEVLCEGWDEPGVSCVVLARPTKSLALYLQMAGRVLRPTCFHCGQPAPHNRPTCIFCGSKNIKTDSICLDHAGAVFEHGFVDDDYDWQLDGRSKIQDRQAEKKKTEPEPYTCPKCSTVFSRKPACPTCGTPRVQAKEAKEVRVGEGILGEVTESPRQLEKERQQRWFSMLVYYGKQQGYNPGWAAHKFKEKFGEYPRGLRGDPKPPDEELLRYIKYLNIRRAKSKFGKRKTKGPARTNA
jgi:DNA repair protein RadD